MASVNVRAIDCALVVRMPKGAGSVCGEWEVSDSGHRMLPITQSGSICLYRGEAKIMGG